MEAYQYWTIMGFVLIILELITLRTFFLVLSGSAFFGAVIAFKFPENYILQVIVFTAFLPLIYIASKPYISNTSSKKEIKNDNK